MRNQYIEENFDSFDSTVSSKKRLKTCKTYGDIKFIDYDNVSSDYNPKFIRFSLPDESNPDENVFKNAYELIKSHWNFGEPRLLISVNGGHKRMNFKNNQQKKDFKQSLIEVMRKDKTWIIAGGFHVGIHKLVSEAVNDYRILFDDDRSQVKLIGISTWGVVKNNQNLTSEIWCYKNDNKVEKGKVNLDPHYDCYLFCDDGTEREYEKEIEFRLNFEKHVRDMGAFAVQILYEGGMRAIENIYRSLQKCIPLVVIRGSGRSSDLICDVLEMDQINDKIIEKYEHQLGLDNEKKDKLKVILPDICSIYKKKITIHDLSDQNVYLDEKILEAIISSCADKALEKTLNLSIRFNCVDIADTRVFQSSSYFTLSQEILENNFNEILRKNRFEMLELFLENNFSIDEFLKKNLQNLYTLPLKSNKCEQLILDLCSRKNKSLDDENLLDIIYQVICDLSDNILKFESFNFISYNSSKNCENSYRELFLWSLLSGYTEMALIFWKHGKDKVGSALIGSIIMNKMKSSIKNKGFNEMSDKLSKMSIKFQELACAIVTESYEINQEKCYNILTRSLDSWNNLSCLQIAVSGNMLDFLNLSACYSYTEETWMGDLSPFLPTLKFLFSFLLIKPLINRYVSIKKNKSVKISIENKNEELSSLKGKLQSRNCQSESYKVSVLKNSCSNLPHEDKSFRISYWVALMRFFETPVVKFYIYVILYFIFLIVFTHLNLVELRPRNESKDQNKITEVLVYIYFIGFIIEEIKQIKNTEKNGCIYKLKSYLSGSWNKYDMTTCFLFGLSIIFRYTFNKDSFIYVRCLYAVILSMFFLRMLQFYFINKSIGPKVIMIKKMIVDIFFFLIIFLLFIVSYGTFSHSLQNPNSKLNISIIGDIFYRPYFQTYGELMLDEFKSSSPCNTTACSVRNVTVIIGFGVFLLMTNVLLFNLLIAVFGYTFNKIQGDSDKLFSFNKIQLVDEFHKKPLVPPPFNTVYYLLKMLWLKIICHERCRRIIRVLRLRKINCKNKILQKEQKNRRTDTFLVKYLKDDQHLKIRGFEHLCMESAMLKNLQSTNVANIKFNFENLLGSILENLENINKRLINKPTKTSLKSS